MISALCLAFHYFFLKPKATKLYIQTDILADRQSDRQIDRSANKKTENQKYKHIGRQAVKQIVCEYIFVNRKVHKYQAKLLKKSGLI